mmetsp:Transcript_4527/g.11588  ORF Transcript_4527/g.11588 Transcript_4527/m.11588 type:complete len:342 (+) Transcript_4527:57-1082(+)
MSGDGATASVDPLDSLLDDALEDFLAEPAPAPAPAATTVAASLSSPASRRLVDCVTRLEAKFGKHPDLDLIALIARDEVAPMEAAPPTPSKVAKGASQSGGDGGGLFKKGFLNAGPSKGAKVKAAAPKAKSKGKGKGPATDTLTAPSTEDVDKGIEDALQGLKESTANAAQGGAAAGAPNPFGLPGMEGMPTNEEDVKKMLDQLMAGGGSEGGMDPSTFNEQFMDTMLAGLFDKQILYTSLTQVNTEYAEFLKDSEAAKSAKDGEDYVGQHALIRKIIAVYEDESLGATAQAKKVMSMMEKMGDLGAPPKSIMTKCGLELGPDGQPIMPGMAPGQPGCSVM